MAAKTQFLTIRFVLLSIFLSLACPSLALEGALPLCKEHKKAITRAQKSRMSTEALMTIASRKDIVFIGESHFEGPREILYGQLLFDLIRKNARFNCLFVEDDFASAAGLHLDKCSENPPDSSSSCLDGPDRLIGIRNVAYKLGLRVYAIDDYYRCRDRAVSSADMSECRDATMNANIQKWIDAGKCDKAVSINGFPHISSIMNGHIPLASRKLKKLNGQPYLAFRINFMFSTFERVEKSFDPRWIWTDWRLAVKNKKEPLPNICADENLPTPIEETYAFLNSALGVKRHPLVWMDNQTFGNWMDFDATIIVGD